MALLIAPEGPLREALSAALEGGRHATAPLDHPDLFGAAQGAGTIVYAPSRPADPERMRRVLGASNAPGVTLIVVVRPPGDDFEPEERLLRRDGKPYVVLAAPEGSPEVGDGLRRALSEGMLQGRVVELSAAPPPKAPAEAVASPPESAPSLKSMRGPSSRKSTAKRWILPALAVGLLFAAHALGANFLQNGCSLGGRGAAPPSAAP